MSQVLLLQQDARQMPLRDGSVHCVVSSPPYWNLRDYGESNQIGLEKRHDCLGWATGTRCESCYLCVMVAVFTECYRILRNDGVMFVIVGDSYAGNASPGGTASRTITGGIPNARDTLPTKRGTGLKPKDLCGIPQRLALALQAAGWYWRSEIIWSKANAMPESVADRPTKSHEQVLMFSKSPRYYFDSFAVREHVGNTTIPGIVDGTDLRGKRVHFSQNFTSQESSPVWPHSPSCFSQDRRVFEICIRLASSLLDLSQLQQQEGMPLFDAQIREQGFRDSYGSSVSNHPQIERSAIVAASLFLQSQISAEAFLQHFKSLGITLPYSNHLGEYGATSDSGSPFTNSNSDRTISINNPSKISQFERIIHKLPPNETLYNIDSDSLSGNRSSGRNLRDVWHLNSEPTSHAHYATFPTELVSRCIRAGSPETCCGSCGKGWQRVVEYGEYDGPVTRGTQGYSSVGKQRDSYKKGLPRRPRLSSTLEPACACPPDPVPSLVYDPFLGSGTTVLVARQLRRHGIGGDLSATYLAIARERLGLKALAAWEGRVPVAQDPVPVDGLPLFEEL